MFFIDIFLKLTVHATLWNRIHYPNPNTHDLQDNIFYNVIICLSQDFVISGFNHY